MIRFLLNSGGVDNSAKKGAKFYNDMVSGFGKNPKVLMCLFAQAREEWEGKFVKYTTAINLLLNDDKQPVYELAIPDEFEKQCARADIICMAGGDDHLIKYWLKQFDLLKVLEGKTVATNSASTHVFCSSFWTCDWRRCFDGLGILPIKSIAHYGSGWGDNDPRGPIDWQAAKKELEQYGDKGLPLYALEEGDYIEVVV